ncbi:hypothetical protein TD95_004856 [Thielaviopsis punctulata]|uniref:Defect at low temperature protein 1 n=1 Tax=Thielaviopsis punctulata TaxID=72032 RepID=A0A0F4ZBT5_9PEZI|nr:hypothetical protein TD95_004856 [Thielaviopsis punctulata]
MLTPRTIFRIIYGASYTILYTILIILLLVSPGDAVYQSWKSGQKNNIWIITIVYFLTMGIMVFIYITRLYINKTALSAIPKTWMPVDKADVKLPVWKMIDQCLSSSAAISFASRPRLAHDLPGSSANLSQPTPIAVVPSHASTADHTVSPKLRSTSHTHPVLEIPPSSAAIWNDIDHPGWSSPNATQMPDVQYSLVYRELPGLIEAKAFALAPVDTSFDASTPPILHSEAAAVLQRPENMSLRDYIAHLTNYNVLPSSPSVAAFLAHYEQAKYSTRPLRSSEFHDMLAHFTRMLHSMQPLDLALLDDDDDDASFFDDDDENASFHSSLSSSRSVRYTDAIDDENLSSVPSTRSNSYASSVRYSTHLHPPSAAQHNRPSSSSSSSSAAAAAAAATGPTPMYKYLKKKTAPFV